MGHKVRLSRCRCDDAVGFLQWIKREHGQDERGASSGSTWDQYELRECEVDPTDFSAEDGSGKDRVTTRAGILRLSPCREIGIGFT
jgi:hypothetical protein